MSGMQRIAHQRRFPFLGDFLTDPRAVVDLRVFLAGARFFLAGARFFLAGARFFLPSLAVAES